MKFEEALKQKYSTISKRPAKVRKIDTSKINEQEKKVYELIKESKHRRKRKDSPANIKRILKRLEKEAKAEREMKEKRHDK